MFRYSSNRIKEWFLLFLVFSLFLSIAIDARAEARKRVLVLHSYHKGLGWTDSITRGIQGTFDTGPVPVSLHYEFMDTKRVFDKPHLENLIRMYSHKYRNVVFDAVISTDDHAFRFLLENSRTLFPETPVVFCGVNGFQPHLLENTKMFTGVVEALSFEETLEAAYLIDPDIQKVYAVVDDTVTGRSNKKQLLDAMERFHRKPQVILLEHRTMEEMKNLTAVLPEKSILIYLSFTNDSAGEKFSLEEGAEMITRSANRPMFSFWDFHLGHGVLGGKMAHGFTQGETAAKLVIRILQGEAPDQIPVINTSPNQYIFDHAVMKKFDLEDARLPPGSVVINRPETFLEHNSQLLLQFLGIIAGLVMIIVIISYNFIKLRIADESLRRSEERFREITELLPETIYEVDRNRQCTFLNESGKQQFQVTDEDIRQGVSYYDLFPAREKETLDKRFDKLEAGELPGLQEYSGIRRNGEEFPVIARSMPIVRDDEIVGIRGILIDISEKKLLEDQVRNAQRMESIGTLAGGIAHDFNNLLMGIQGRASLALAQTDPKDPVYEHLNGIDACVRSAAGLTRQLLGFARVGKYDVKPADINRLVSNTSEMFGRTRKEVQIKHTFQDDIWAVEVDRSQMEQVLLNLFINSWHAMDGTGTISVVTENVMLDQRGGTALSVDSGPYVRLLVSDTGSGIPPEIKEKIFDPFFTTKERGRGTGLGLASSYGIIKNHKGAIDVVSEPGKGATFRIHLPAKTERADEESLQEKGVVSGKETLLLVDDEEVVREVTKDLLRQLGYTVHVADSGNKAIQMVDSLKEKIDMVLLDMIMPDMTGEETFREIRKIRPDLPVLLSSGYSVEEKAAKMIDEGCNSFIQKPFDLQTLSVKVREVLQ